MTELLSSELVNVSDGSGINSTGDEINLISLNVFDHHNVLLCEEMKGEVTDSLTENALLEEDDIDTGLDDLFH